MTETLREHLNVQVLKGEPPWDLLLLADPSRSQIETYLADGQCYVAFINDKVVGTFVLLQTKTDSVELMNIAIYPSLQGKGLGRALLDEVISVAQNKGMKLLEVGTGNSSLDQLAFYQKAGFRISGVDRDFFVRNYQEDIIENGIKCLDMIRLSREL